MSETFRHPYVIGLHDSDAAGIIFFANLLRICNIGHEAMLEKIGFGLGSLLKKKTMGLPIVHFEGDFLRYLTVGDRVEIAIRVGHIGTSSVRLDYELIAVDGEVSARASVVSVCVDPVTRKSMPIPRDFRAALETYA